MLNHNFFFSYLYLWQFRNDFDMVCTKQLLNVSLFKKQVLSIPIYPCRSYSTSNLYTELWGTVYTCTHWIVMLNSKHLATRAFHRMACLHRRNCLVAAQTPTGTYPGFVTSQNDLKWNYVCQLTWIILRAVTRLETRIIVHLNVLTSVALDTALSKTSINWLKITVSSFRVQFKPLAAVPFTGIKSHTTVGV